MRSRPSRCLTPRGRGRTPHGPAASAVACGLARAAPPPSPVPSPRPALRTRRTNLRALPGNLAHALPCAQDVFFPMVSWLCPSLQPGLCSDATSSITPGPCPVSGVPTVLSIPPGVFCVHSFLSVTGLPSWDASSVRAGTRVSVLPLPGAWRVLRLCMLHEPACASPHFVISSGLIIIQEDVITPLFQ